MRVEERFFPGKIERSEASIRPRERVERSEASDRGSKQLGGLGGAVSPPNGVQGQRPGKFWEFSPSRCPEIAIPACFHRVDTLSTFSIYWLLLTFWMEKHTIFTDLTAEMDMIFTDFQSIKDSLVVHTPKYFYSFSLCQFVLWFIVWVR